VATTAITEGFDLCPMLYKIINPLAEYFKENIQNLSWFPVEN
jgi:hypothetical protein